MTIRFIMKYSTGYGQALFISLTEKNSPSNSISHFLPLTYLNKDYWQLVIDTDELKLKDAFTYQYSLQEYSVTIQTLQNDFNLNWKKFKTNSLEVFDEWRGEELFSDLFKTRPFSRLLTGLKPKEQKKSIAKHSTHLFRVKSPEMAERYQLCLIGSAKKMNEWSEEDPILLQKSDEFWSTKLNLSKELFPVEYKIGVYDKQLKKIVKYEDGENRSIQAFEEDKTLRIINMIADFMKFAWRGTGINVQLSSLKTNRSWGIGDFTDLFLLTDWSREVGIKLIQLLPVNDTTATHTSKDSYPYSAISAFALHPNFLNVQKLATSFSVKFKPDVLDEIKVLNELPNLDYERVILLKQDAIRELYKKEKQYFKDDLDWFEFFELNRGWLQPYAAFCFLRDKYKSADFTQWDTFAVYDEDAVGRLTATNNEDYDEIAIHYFTQYHLYLQLRDATDYAHKHSVVLKADLPIGVGRCSVDTWMYPHLFHMDKQAGAPPDAFAVTGQNWSFPTYDWKNMSLDNYAWWRQRMEQLSTYFDAVRIDHVLGFFRIWSIPFHSVEGILGRFIPANPLSAHDFSNEGMYFDEHRLCNPFVSEELLQQSFGDYVNFVKEQFFENFNFKADFDTQRKIADWFKLNPGNYWMQQKLFDLLTNVVLIRDEEQGKYHFRINIFETISFKYLNDHDRQILDRLYNRYFFFMQDELWREEGIKKIAALKNASNNMLLCGEDLGMVPGFVPGVLHKLEILSLQVERMPKKNTKSFSPPAAAQYDCVVTPSTHDMSTLREWWEEDRITTQVFYNENLGHYGLAPFYCESWIAKDVIAQHLHSPAMWSVFLFQDLLATSDELRRQNPMDERINVPADPNHVWNYRMHLTLETISNNKNFNSAIADMIAGSGR